MRLSPPQPRPHIQHRDKPGNCETRRPAPAALREQLAGLYKDRLIHACEQLPEPETLTTPSDAVIVAIKSLAARCNQLDTEAARLERHADTITATAAPELRAIYGVGPDTAATLPTALGDNPARIGSDAAFAKLCGVRR
jgi:transposase